VYVYFREHAGQRVMVALNRNEAATPLGMARFAGSLGGARGGVDVLGDRRIEFGDSLLLPARAPLVIELD
jgi:hypothetical protein